MPPLNSQSRRSFLKTGLSFLGVGLCNQNPPLFIQLQDLDKKIEHIRRNLLQLVNEERALEKVQVLEFDDLATRVATQHAVDMATGEFASHWGRDGLKPYQRYSLAGGLHATQENVSAADNTWSLKLEDLIQDTSYLHVRLYNETPPNDGHRKAILAPQHTHVGFGIAIDRLRLRMVQLFVAKYVDITSQRQTARPGENFVFSGRLLNSSHLLNSVETFYEPLPKPPEMSWLREARSYSLPSESIRLRPKLTLPVIYADGKPGVIVVKGDGSFAVPITLFKSTPGIYTIVVWVKRSSAERAFPATAMCIRAE